MGIDGMRMGGNGNVRIHSGSSLVGYRVRQKSRTTLKLYSVSDLLRKSILKHGIKQICLATTKFFVLLKEFKKKRKQTNMHAM